MARAASVAGLALLAPAFGCAGSADSSTEDEGSVSADELTAHTPDPFALQFVGKYVPAKGSEVASVELDRDGRYLITFHGSTPREHGSWHASTATKTLPLTLRLVTRGRLSTLRIAAYDRAAVLSRNHVPTTVHATTAVGPDESICDASSGSWTDDDADPATGLYCVCPAGKSYIPSEGGCIK